MDARLARERPDRCKLAEVVQFGRVSIRLPESTAACVWTESVNFSPLHGCILGQRFFPVIRDPPQLA